MGGMLPFPGFHVSLCRRRMGQYHWGPEGTLSGAGVVGAGWIVTKDSELMQGENADPPAAPLDESAGSAAVPTDAGSVGALQRSVRHATLGLAAYTVVALGLIGWSLRRGRLSDAVLLLVAMAVTLSPILSYRKQLRQRLRAIDGGEGTVERTPTEGVTEERTPTEGVTGGGIDSGAQGGSSPSSSAEA